MSRFGNARAKSLGGGALAALCAAILAASLALAAPAPAEAAVQAADAPALGRQSAKVAIASARAKSFTYAGERTCKATVKGADGKTLKAGRDYKVVSAKYPASGKCTAVVRGKGAYTGAKRVSWTIKKAPMSKAKVAAVASVARTGKAIKPKPAVKLAGTTLKLGCDYKVSYASNKKAGVARIKITGAGYMKGAKTVRFRICPRKQPMAARAVNAAVANDRARAVKAVSVSKAKGKVTYANVSTQAAAKKLKVNAKTGKVTVPKGAKAGTYAVKIKVSAAGNKTYASGAKTVTARIAVKAKAAANAGSPTNKDGATTPGVESPKPGSNEEAIKNNSKTWSDYARDENGDVPELRFDSNHKHVYDQVQVEIVPAVYRGWLVCTGCDMTFEGEDKDVIYDAWSEHHWKMVEVGDSTHGYRARSEIVKEAVYDWRLDPTGEGLDYDHRCICGEFWRP